MGIVGDYHLLREYSFIQFSTSAAVFWEPSHCLICWVLHDLQLPCICSGLSLRTNALCNTGACDDSDSVVLHEVVSQHVEKLGRPKSSGGARQENENLTVQRSN